MSPFPKHRPLFGDVRYLEMSVKEGFTTYDLKIYWLNK